MKKIHKKKSVRFVFEIIIEDGNSDNNKHENKDDDDITIEKNSLCLPKHRKSNNHSNNHHNDHNNNQHVNEKKM